MTSQTRPLGVDDELWAYVLEDRKREEEKKKKNKKKRGRAERRNRPEAKAKENATHRLYMKKNAQCGGKLCYTR